MQTDVLTARDGSTYQATRDDASGTWSIADFPVFAAGTWHGKPYTPEIIDRCIDSTERARKYREPSIGFGHGTKGEDRTARPRYGKVGELYRKGAVVFAKALHGIKDVVFQAIKAGALGHPSIGLVRYSNPDTGEQEINFGYLDFTGIIPPEVSTIVPATDFGSFSVTEAEAVLSWDGFRPFAADIVTQTDPAGDHGQSVPVAPDAQAQEEGKDPMSDELKARADTLAAENAALKARIEASEKAAKDAVDAREADRRTQFSAYVASKIDMLVQEEYIKEGEKQSVQGAVAGINPLAEQAFSAVDNLVSVWQARGKVKAPNTGKPAGKPGDAADAHADDDPDERMHFAAVELCERRHWDPENYVQYGKALCEVAHTDKKLADSVVEQFTCQTYSGSLANERRL